MHQHFFGRTNDEVNYDEEIAQLRKLKLTSFLEGSTLLVLLLIAVPLKHFSGWPFGVQVMGPIHGIAFCVYLWLVLQTASSFPSRAQDIFRMIVLAVVPFGGFVNSSSISKRMKTLHIDSVL